MTADRGKPALPVLGKPLVGYVAEYLAQNGVTEAVVNLHHRPESVRESLGDGSKFGLHLEYVYEPVILGTSGGLDNAREFFQEGTFICVNGKSLRILICTLRSISSKAERSGDVNAETKYASRAVQYGGDRRRAGDGLCRMPQPAESDVNAPLMFTGIPF